VEEEKKVDRLLNVGANAVSGDTGADSKWLPAHVELLRGLRVILWPDSDPLNSKGIRPGEQYIANAAAAIRTLEPGADIRVVRPFAVDGVPDGSKRDVCDWTGNADSLGELAASAQAL